MLETTVKEKYVYIAKLFLLLFLFGLIVEAVT